MFSKTKINDAMDAAKTDDVSAGVSQSPFQAAQPAGRPAGSPQSAGGAPHRGAPKPAPSIISADLTIKGNLETSGDMQIEGVIEGDIRSHLLTIGQNATVRGEIVADDVVVNGRVIGRIRGQKIRLSATARVEGDILHKNIAIESGAQFEGSVQRSDDPLSNNAQPKKLAATPGVAMPMGSVSQPAMEPK